MNINDKTSPNQMRILMKRIRTGNYVVSENKETTKHELSMRDMLKITRTRSINEDVEDQEAVEPENKKTVQDQAQEEQKLTARLGDNVDIKFSDLVVTDKYVFFGGTVNNEFIFTYKVPNNEETDGVQFNYFNSFNPDDEENKKIIKEIENYYNEFAAYWMRNAIQKFDNRM
jgi:hypothetical protein